MTVKAYLYLVCRYPEPSVEQGITESRQPVKQALLPHLPNLLQPSTAWPPVDGNLEHLFVHVDKPGIDKHLLQMWDDVDRSICSRARLCQVEKPLPEGVVGGDRRIVASDIALGLLHLEPAPWTQSGEGGTDDPLPVGPGGHGGQEVDVVDVIPVVALLPFVVPVPSDREVSDAIIFIVARESRAQKSEQLRTHRQSQTGGLAGQEQAGWARDRSQ